MRFGLAHVAPMVLVAVGIGTGAAACSAADKRNGFDVESADASAEGGDPGFIPGDTECAGLECKRVKCDDGSTTTLTGKVYDPAGVNPLYNVMVYIPGGPNGDAELPAISEGVSCDKCASVALSPLVSAITNAQGEFTLENVPVTENVPIVIQIGKWRRKMTIDITESCAENKVPAKEFRLPRNGSEGDMPQIAVSTGALDAFECFLRGVGVDDEEFVPGAGGDGHIHVFNGSGGNFPGAPEAGGTDADPMGGELWNDVEKLKPYDIVLLSCEGGEYNENKGGEYTGARQAMWDYANLGGRIFATHFHYTWFKNSPQLDWQQIAAWGSAGGGGNGTYNVVNETLDGSPFPKGAALADWLVTVKASTAANKGKIALSDVTDSLSSVNSPAQSWLQKTPEAVRYFSFNAPVGEAPENQCGRAVYSDVHLMGDGGGEFPEDCPSSGSLTPQQKALEFMFFDLSGCVQADDVPPSPPK